MRGTSWQPSKFMRLLSSSIGNGRAHLRHGYQCAPLARIVGAITPRRLGGFIAGRLLDAFLRSNCALGSRRGFRLGCVSGRLCRSLVLRCLLGLRLGARYQLFWREIAEWVPPLLHIQMKVIFMIRVGLRSKYGAENLAGAIVDFAQKTAFEARRSNSSHRVW
jgi:hypothetical protein